MRYKHLLKFGFCVLYNKICCGYTLILTYVYTLVVMYVRKYLESWNKLNIVSFCLLRSLSYVRVCRHRGIKSCLICERINNYATIHTCVWRFIAVLKKVTRTQNIFPLVCWVSRAHLRYFFIQKCIQYAYC